ncbi:CidB/LrgB family autolysis modulator [Aneurinibacillus terranovensis]|uniref:CidB/LrgB family autolysis modulator n=1 Tax=Aneurinibacillus terranovensis TaxID=278991 RepID=UPI00048998CE|nr:CidB/LrgB family autolysis modulator [Aneurinibacillus terranovensis]
MLSGILCLVLTVLAYWAAKKLYRFKNIVVLSPLLVTPLLLILFLSVSHISYGTYNSGAKWLTAMLQPATVAFAIPLYKYFQLLKRHAVEILISVVFGSCIAILSSVVLAGFVHLNPQMVDSILPRSITTPIAMNVSQTLGGIPTMTAVFVILTGICGMVIGPFVIRFLQIRNSIARGVLLGMGAHGAGTSKALELGSIEGAIASLAMIIASIVTLFIAPLAAPFLVN